MRRYSLSRFARLLGVALVAACVSGCLSGAIYSHVTRPLDVNLDRTPVQQGEARDSWKTFRYYVRIDWGTDGLGDVAAKHGLTRIDYADLETLTVLGIWTQRWAHVYGE